MEFDGRHTVSASCELDVYTVEVSLADLVEDQSRPLDTLLPHVTTNPLGPP